MLNKFLRDFSKSFIWWRNETIGNWNWSCFSGIREEFMGGEVEDSRVKGIYGAKGTTVCLCLSEDWWALETMVSCQDEYLPYSRLSLVYDFASLRICISCLLHLGKNLCCTTGLPIFVKGRDQLDWKACCRQLSTFDEKQQAALPFSPL